MVSCSTYITAQRQKREEDTRRSSTQAWTQDLHMLKHCLSATWAMSVTVTILCLHNPLSPTAPCTVCMYVRSNHRCTRTELLFFFHPLQQRDVTRSLAEKKTSLSASVSSLKQQLHIYQTQLKDKEKLIKWAMHMYVWLYILYVLIAVCLHVQTAQTVHVWTYVRTYVHVQMYMHPCCTLTHHVCTDSSC